MTHRGAIEAREGWGMTNRALCSVRRARSVEDVAAALDEARRLGVSIHCWGNGRSYGDAALNEGNLLLDLSGMDQITSWDRETGVVVVQPGVTLEKLWKHVLPDGYWPPVVSGTMFTTVGGLAAANAHGKNNFEHGPIGEHILSFTLMTIDGQTREVTRESDPELFHAAIGGFGWLGVFTSLTLKMKKVHSGRLDVLPIACPDLTSMFRTFERLREEKWDYVVGWIDAFPGGSASGRGQIHAARYLEPGADPEAVASLVVAKQELPLTFFGVIPKSILFRLMKPFSNRLGMRLINYGRYTWMTLGGKSGHKHPQEHARFNFLLDYVPRWKEVYKPGGLIQVQLFLPKEVAEAKFAAALQMAREERLEPWLVVMKRHRSDGFWLSHAVDGYSFACDFPVQEGRRGDLLRLARRWYNLCLDSGGRFYLAKDSALQGETWRRSLGDAVERFLALKARLDPQGLLGGSQFRRLFPAPGAETPPPALRTDDAP